MTYVTFPSTHKGEGTGQSLKALLVEDSEEDALLLERTLRKGGYIPQIRRVDTLETFKNALFTESWDIVFADYTLPHFSGIEALEYLKQVVGLDIPFIIVSGTIVEDIAVKAMKAGASDYILKSNLARLIPAIERELHEAAIRTKQRQAEEALNKSEMRLQHFVESNIIGIVFSDRQGNIQYANDAFLEMIGYSREELVNGTMRWTDLTPPEFLHMDEHGIQECLEKGACTPYEKQYIHKSGRILDVLIGYAMMAGSQEEFICFILDISQQKQAQRALQKSLERERLIRRITEVTSRTFDIREITQSIAKMIGQFFAVDRCLITRLQPREDYFIPVLYGQYCRSTSIPQIHQLQLPIKSCPARWRNVGAPVLFKIADTEDSELQVETQMLLDHCQLSPDVSAQSIDLYFRQNKIRAILICEILYRGIPYGSISLHQCQSARQWTDEECELLKDIATYLGVAFYQADLYQQERQSREAAEIANQKKSQFLAIMSHELRTPLNAVIGYSEMLLKGMAPTPEKQRRYAYNISVSGHHLLNMVNDILDLTKVEVGKIQLSLEQVQLATVIEHLKGFFYELAQAKQVQLIFESNPDTIEVEADPTRLRQILINLISNGIKFNKQGGTVWVRFSLSDNRQWLICKVTDTGIGIPQGKQEELFSEFYQVDNSLARRHEGTGLGLALTKRLVELHHGHISVESQESVGTTFTFTIPLTAPRGSDDEDNPKATANSGRLTAAKII